MGLKTDEKQTLLGMFPELPVSFEKQMKQRGAHNYAVLLTRGNELFARCYHHYADGKLIERQRYAFTPKGAVRYGWDEAKGWQVRREFREPVFRNPAYGYSFDNGYTVLNFAVIGQSCMKYSQAETYAGGMLMCYLWLYCRHPNLEYLMKQGYSCLLEEIYTGYWGNVMRLKVSELVNWKTNDLLKMLGLNRDEFKLLRGRENLYEMYCAYREDFPRMKPADILAIAQLIGARRGTFDICLERTGLSAEKLMKYLIKQEAAIGDYYDYLEQCRRLNYDRADPAVSLPRDFHAKHEQLAEIERVLTEERLAKKTAQQDRLIAELTEYRRKLEFKHNGLILIQPKSVREIVDEGAALSHCVGGYAERHAKGALHIMFLRRANQPDVPWYTMEVSKELKIVQCRGYKNNVERIGGSPKAPEVVEFENVYREYLAILRSQENKKARKTA
jgi:hypothetical protein